MVDLDPQYVQVLRLLESFDLEALHGAVKDALRLGAIGYDAVKHLVLCRIERRPAKLDLDIYPYLPRANVATTAAASYMSLLQEGGGGYPISRAIACAARDAGYDGLVYPSFFSMLRNGVQGVVRQKWIDVQMGHP